jgi:hypothetical protein
MSGWRGLVAMVSGGLCGIRAEVRPRIRNVQVIGLGGADCRPSAYVYAGSILHLPLSEKGLTS